MLDGKVVAFRNDRLGARLNALLNAARIARDYGPSLAVSWPDHAGVSPELQNPGELFTRRFIDRRFIKGIGFAELQAATVDLSALPLDSTRADLDAMLAQGRALLCSAPMQPSVLPWEERDDIMARLPGCLDRRWFTHPVRWAMDRVDAAIAGRSFVAYHLRRGDIVDPAARASQTLWPSKYVPRVFYEHHVRTRLEPDAIAAVFSDEPREAAALSAIDPRMVPIAALIGDDSLTTLQRDFIEIYAMSRAACIVAPAASAFSTVAATLGGGRIVPLIDDLGPQGCAEALDQLTDRLARGPHLFLGDADLGQNLPFVIKHQIARGTPEVSDAIVHGLTARGFDRSYIWDLAAEALFRAADLDGQLRLIDAMHAQPASSEQANAPVYVRAGLTALRVGDIAAAARFAQIGNWLAPIHPHTRLLLNALMMRDGHDERTAYPIDRTLIATRRVDPAAIIHADARLLTGAEDAVAMPWLLFDIDIRDWIALQSPRLPPLFVRPELARKTLALFDTAYGSRRDEPGVISARGVMLAAAGLREEAADHLARAVAADGGATPLYRKRLICLGLDAGNDGSSLLAQLKDATEQAGHHPCYLAELGRRQVHAGRTGDAMATARELAECSHGMVELHVVAADILRRRAAGLEPALAAARKARALAPRSVRLAALESLVLRKMGNATAAEGVMAPFAREGLGPVRFSSRLSRSRSAETADTPETI